MPFVLDASVTASWAFPDEQNSVADRIGQLLESSADSAIVPSLWWFEVRNILLVNERRGRTTVARSTVFLEQLAQQTRRIEEISKEEHAILTDLHPNVEATQHGVEEVSQKVRNGERSV